MLGELEEIVVATLSPPRLRLEDEEEIEQETGLVGESEGGAPADEGDAESSGDGASGDDGE